MRLYNFCVSIICAAILALPAEAGVLYAARAAGETGELYIINPANGAVVQDIGPLNDSSAVNYPITGLAFHPTTGVLYGSTGNNPASTAAKLVTINPASGLVTVIGNFDAGPVNGSGTPSTMADLAFDAAGTLYGVGSIGGPQLYTINTATGKATVVGSTGLTSTSGGGLAIDAGAFYGTPTSSRFGTYNSVTGAYTNIVNPTKPLGGAYAALAFDGGVLYGLNLGPGPALATRLVTFNTTTGAVTELGASAMALDAIAFQIPEPTSLILGAAGIALIATRRKRA